MILWVESQSVAAITLIVFALCYAISIFAFVTVAAVANRRVSADLKATTPVILTPLSVVASLLIAFLASRVWANLDRAHSYVSQEVGAINQLLLFSDALPQDTQQAVRHGVHDYLAYLERQEWPAMAKSTAVLDGSPPGLTSAFHALTGFKAAGSGQEIAQQRGVAALQSALEARHQRILLSQAVIHPFQWTVILVLAGLLLLTLACVHLDRPATTMFALFLMSTALATCLVLLLVNDRPFAEGGLTIEPSAYRQIEVP